MPPPFVVLCISGVAFFFLIQMLLCQAYHFHVTISKKRKVIVTGDLQTAPHKKNSGVKSAKMNPSRGVDDTEVDETMENAGMDEKSNSGDVNDNTPNHPSESLPPRHISNPTEDRRNRRKSVFAESYDPSKDDEETKVIHPKTEEERNWLIKSMSKIPLFQHLAKDQIETVVDAIQKHPVIEDEFIMKQGDKGTSFYIVQTGIYNVYVKNDEGFDKLVHTYTNKGSFGELALLYNQPRAATIKAMADGVLWTVDGQTFRRIVYKITYQKRIMYENLINNVPILKSLEPYERANLVDALTPMTFEHEAEIIKQGEEGDGMYFIINGGVRIVMATSDNKEVLVKEYGQGDYFGELALITKKKRAASAYAVGQTNLAFLDRDAFERLLGPCMEVMKRNIYAYSNLLSDVMKEDSP